MTDKVSGHINGGSGMNAQDREVLQRIAMALERIALALDEKPPTYVLNSVVGDVPLPYPRHFGQQVGAQSGLSPELEEKARAIGALPNDEA